jgi:hypothetical protein
MGVSLHVGAERIGDGRYVVRRHGASRSPGSQARLAHGDEIVTVEGTALSARSYEK